MSTEKLQNQKVSTIRERFVTGVRVITAATAITFAVPENSHAAPLPDTGTSTNTCEFVLGFKVIKDLIPEKVGDCKNNQSYNAIGDSVQDTTGPDGKGGLLAWRKADNWTAYTDGYRTWVNGPNGLQQRLNTERFSFEAEEKPTTFNFPPLPADGRTDIEMGFIVKDIPWFYNPGNLSSTMGKFEKATQVNKEIVVTIAIDKTTGAKQDIVLLPGDKGYLVNFIADRNNKVFINWTQTHSAEETLAAINVCFKPGNPIYLRNSTTGKQLSYGQNGENPFTAEIHSYR